MAERRMFALKIVRTGKFLSLSKTARLLYYDLGMDADDEGAAEWIAVSRLSGATKAALHELEKAGFVRMLENGLTVWIVDFKNNNYLDKNRVRPSLYHDLIEKEMEKIRLQGSAETDSALNGGLTDVKQALNQCSVEESSVVQYSESERAGARAHARTRGTKAAGEGGEAFAAPTADEVRAYCKEAGIALDAERFVDHYATTGWRINGTPIRDWRARARKWAREDAERAPQQTAQSKPACSSYDTDEFFAAAVARSYAAYSSDADKEAEEKS